MTDEQYLRKLIEEGEHDQQDFKYKIQEAAKLARSVSAFANTRGGRLLIGVRDDGHISGVKSEEEIFMMHAAAFKYCTPESAIRFDTLHVEGRSVVIATIPPAQRKPIKAIDEGAPLTPTSASRMRTLPPLPSTWRCGSRSNGPPTRWSMARRPSR